MTQFREVRKKPEIEIERLDGGLNKKDGPSKIDITESPDCLNVDFGDRGSVGTRAGTSYYNSSAIATAAGNGLTVYNGSMVAWTNGRMFRMSGTTAVEVTAASGNFTTGLKVAYGQYQNILFVSDGTNGPWRWEGNESFYKMGIDVPSAPTAASNVAGASLVPTGTHYYAVSFVNTHAVEGEIGSFSASVTLATSAAVMVTSIPTGSTIQGVAARRIYRSTSQSGPWGLVASLTGNATSSVTDTVATVGAEPPEDASSPKPFSTIHLFKDRLFMEDNDAPTILRYTDYNNPFVSQAENFFLLDEGGDRGDIKAISDQNDVVSIFKENSIFLLLCEDPADDQTFQIIKSPANVGITGCRALVKDDNGILFVGKRFDHIVGVGYLSGTDLVETQTQYLMNKVLSRKIEADVLNYPSSLWDDISMFNFKNRIYLGVPASVNSTRIDGALLFDVNRLVQDSDTDPGSWSPWTGTVGVNDWTVFGNELYGISSNTDGLIIKFNRAAFTDADGTAINSYWWSKEIGGEPNIESWVKDFRHILPWVEKLGSYFMNMRVRIDGDEGVGDAYQIDLTPSGGLWSQLWGNFLWGAGSQRQEIEIPVGPRLGKRIQIGFDNQNTVGQGFKVHSFKIRMNLRRQR